MTFDLDVAIRLLRITTPMWATIAFASMTVGLVTNAWLYSEEKMPNQHFNRTGDPDLEFLSKYTFSGLWSLCFTNPGEKEEHCFNIDYFPQEEYSPDPNDSTLSIPYAVLRSAPFFFMATALLVMGEVACFLGHFAPKRRYCTFLSGVTFILSGLLLLLGLVVYVSVFTAEIGSKLRPSSSLQPPLFTYTYGYSFQMVVTGFLAAEVAGTSAVFLFIYWHRNRIAKKEMHRKMTMALVQTPIEISQAGHLLPPFPVNQLEQHHQNQGDEHITAYYEGRNGFVPPMKSMWVPNDDDSSIPTPPPAAVYPRHECPVHRQQRQQQLQQQLSDRSYVSVHNAASPVTVSRSHYGMPDITAFSQLMHQQRQISTESESYKVISDSNSLRNVQQQQQVCHQCLGAGHVSVRVPLARDITSSTMFTSVDLDMSPDGIEQDRRSLCAIGPSGSRSSLPIHHGSLRRITAV